MSIVQIAPRVLARKLSDQEPVLLVDVRQPWEHELVALPGSVLIPLGELEERAGELTQAEGALVVAYCHHGVRSLSAAAILEAHGLRGVASLAGGIDRWSLEVDPSLQRY
jgi:adenylyltransferase/sulfurtransferase